MSVERFPLFPLSAHLLPEGRMALRIFEPYDVVVDGTDNFPTRYLVNDACVLLNKPNCVQQVLHKLNRFGGGR